MTYERLCPPYCQQSACCHSRLRAALSTLTHPGAYAHPPPCTTDYCRLTMLALPINPPAPHLHASPNNAPSSSTKRPKLSLQTGGLPITYGKSTTALATSLSAAPIFSPTAINTFNNAYDVPHRQSPANTSPASRKVTRPSSRLVSPYAIQSREDQPYQLPVGVRGILRNTPYPYSVRRSSIATNSAGSAARRVFFPAPKRVAYCFPLEEEIKTTRFTTSHLDLLSDESEEATKSDGSEDSEGSQPSDSSEEDEEREGNKGEKSGPRKKRKSVEGHSQRQVQAAALRDGLRDEAEYEPTTPAHGSRRKRRRREWKWTLGPVDRSSDQADSLAPSPASKGNEEAAPMSEANGLPPTRHNNEHLSSPSEIPLPVTPEA